ncbi:beta/gamma crystallin-related protein [Thermoflavimicrobium daqui]|uniref:Beta/gamma crystallin 'Greek key' domain-containing protein n=1 Tax=Thermoflavimicrobium daqui TaxID=2137476 RepID=A0A364K2K4_9BACL|nr:beta/gamma crystallin-related protein [Thermoflavimicrobium daqui]RAL22571.1 hypothetical protein DL897_14260 [Thermoflavimicrobium daqui]
MKQISKWVSVCFISALMSSLSFSLVASASPAAVVFLYEHGYYQGEEKRVAANPGVSSLGSMNDKTSSIKVRGHCVRVFEHENFKGKSLRVCQDIDDLSKYGFNDQISSIYVD